MSDEGSQDVGSDEAEVSVEVPLFPWEKDGSAKPSDADNVLALLESAANESFIDDEDATDKPGKRKPAPKEIEDDEEVEDDDEGHDDEDEIEDDEEVEDDDEDDIDEDADDEDDEDEDGDSDDDDREPETYEVPGDPDGDRVTLEEALAGYSRTADYTRKRQADSAEAASELAEVHANRDLYAARLTQVAEVLDQLHPAVDEAAMAQLRQDDPAEWAAVKQEQTDADEIKARVKGEQDRITADKVAESNEALQAHVQVELGRLVEAVPEWKTQATLTEGLAELQEFAQETYGFTEAEMGQVIDHRLLLLLREVQQSRKTRKKGKKEIRKKRKGRPVLKPGASRKPRSKAARQKQGDTARNRLVKTGSVDDAAALIEMYLGDND